MRIPPVDPSRTRGSVLSTALDGFRFIGRNELIIMVMILSLATSLFGRSYNALLPVFAKDTLDVGIQGLGMMNSAPGAGSIVGAVLIGMNLRLPPNGVLSLGGMAALALLLIGFASSESYALSLVLLFLLGVLGTALITATRTILQLKSAEGVHGPRDESQHNRRDWIRTARRIHRRTDSRIRGRARYALYISAACVLIAAVLLTTVRPTLRRAT